ncbi:tyrosine-specific transport protein [Waddlia chondrophila 2032/99]|nr:aromatic amino acid transport family protein [Waddlia chondrophila]CCB91840.1 tyrosine-specific transport protein [Waddlia chondrophila 2032/99]
MDRKLIIGTLLVSGTCIGGGMLALPVLTSLGGFVPSMVIFLLCWLFMAGTGLLFLEVCHWMNGDTNIVSMAGKTLGKGGKAFAWLLYLFMFYCLTLAYIVGCGNLVTEILPLPAWAGSLVFVAVFSPAVFFGARVVGRVNSLLMVGLLVSYFVFVAIGIPYVNVENLKHIDWPSSLLALPVAFTSFAYQGIIPTLSRYMEFNIRKTRSAILLGSFLPFAAYVIWQWLILGIVPTFSENGLADTLEVGGNAVDPLKFFIKHSSVYTVGQFFAFFALTTSFYGVTLGLLDFLADGLDIKKDAKGKFFLSMLVFVPPLFLAVSYPRVFLTSLEYAGGYGSALLLGLLPILMVWSGRYCQKLPSKYSLFGGRITLVLMLLFVIFEIIFETAHLIFH